MSRGYCDSSSYGSLIFLGISVGVQVMITELGARRLCADVTKISWQSAFSVRVGSYREVLQC